MHLHGPPHGLDALGVAAGLPGAEENRGDGSRGGKPSHEREHMAQQPALEEQRHHASPWRRSSMRAHSMTPMPIRVTASSPPLRRIEVRHDADERVVGLADGVLNGAD